MGSGILTRYNASAGSGKTYKLTSIYLTRLFTSRNGYKRILAVTFTNKAASEMKRKILSQLNSLAKGEDSGMMDDILRVTGKSADELIKSANKVLYDILHDYSFFNVGTIDSFFQKVLKAFTREIGLNHGYVIELDHSLILKRAVDSMLASTAEDLALREWITEYSYERAEGGKSWNLNEDIIKLAGEIFREKFRLMSSDERDKIKDRSFLIEYTKELKSIQAGFKKNLSVYSVKCREILVKHDVKDDMFLRGERGGVPSFLRMIEDSQQGIWKPPTATVSQVLDTPPVWTSRTGISQQLNAALDDGFRDIFIKTLSYYNENFARSNTARLISDNIYILGILSNILEQVHKINSSENRFLLSDAGELLWLIIKDDQTPFIYEKAGNAFENFMIDEFQDTSHIQWNNFRPLIENSMAEGNDNLVVGDVKQSIYRWRNSDWKILNSLLNEQIRESGLHDEYLDTNWRSSKNIIKFNNALFSILPVLIDRSEKNNTGQLVLQKIYKDAVQKNPGIKEEGIVRIEFLNDADIPFEESALARLPGLIEELQDNGYSGSDIGILVRTNREGASVLNSILEYRESAGENKRKKYNYNIISSDSLLLSAAPSVIFIVTLLKCLYEDDRLLSLSLMLRKWFRMEGVDPLSADLMDPEGEAEKYFPAGYSIFMNGVKEMTLFEAVEKIIHFFKLGANKGNTAYLNSFQDCVMEFSGNYSADIPSFLDWWDNTGVKRSVVVSDQPDSMRVLTIHKAKGLEFRAVIVPFISWNMGHGSSGPAMWVKPSESPFNKLGTVPVRYKSDLQYSHFADDYYLETYNALVDNINLLYVAFTRAIDCLYGYCPGNSRSGSIAAVLYETFTAEEPDIIQGSEINLSKLFDAEKNVITYGSLPEITVEIQDRNKGRINAGGYFVNDGIQNLHLKFHSDNWLLASSEEREKRINYGLLMHEILESVKIGDDVPGAIQKMLLQGRITENDKTEIETRIFHAMSVPEVREWFRPGLMIMNEAEILLPDGTTRRPDRIIITDDKVIIIDFKFGKEKNEHKRQVNEYSRLLEVIEKKSVEAFIWYVDSNLIVRA
jgi:ATP-dependent helicase/nuclease subunit A